MQYLTDNFMMFRAHGAKKAARFNVLPYLDLFCLPAVEVLLLLGSEHADDAFQTTYGFCKYGRFLNLHYLKILF